MRKQKAETETKKNTPSQLGDDDAKEDEEEEEYDPWNDDFSKVDHSATEKPKATQQDMNGNIPSIPQEQS